MNAHQPSPTVLYGVNNNNNDTTTTSGLSGQGSTVPMRSGPDRNVLEGVSVKELKSKWAGGSKLSVPPSPSRRGSVGEGTHPQVTPDARCATVKGMAVPPTTLSMPSLSSSQDNTQSEAATEQETKTTETTTTTTTTATTTAATTTTTNVSKASPMDDATPSSLLLPSSEPTLQDPDGHKKSDDSNDDEKPICPDVFPNLVSSDTTKSTIEYPSRSLMGSLDAAAAVSPRVASPTMDSMTDSADLHIVNGTLDRSVFETIANKLSGSVVDLPPETPEPTSTLPGLTILEAESSPVIPESSLVLPENTVSLPEPTPVALEPNPSLPEPSASLPEPSTDTSLEIVSGDVETNEGIEIVNERSTESGPKAGIEITEANDEGNVRDGSGKSNNSATASDNEQTKLDETAADVEKEGLDESEGKEEEPVDPDPKGGIEITEADHEGNVRDGLEGSNENAAYVEEQTKTQKIVPDMEKEGLHENKGEEEEPVDPDPKEETELTEADHKETVSDGLEASIPSAAACDKEQTKTEKIVPDMKKEGLNESQGDEEVVGVVVVEPSTHDSEVDSENPDGNGDVSSSDQGDVNADIHNSDGTAEHSVCQTATKELSTDEVNESTPTEEEMHLVDDRVEAQVETCGVKADEDDTAMTGSVTVKADEPNKDTNAKADVELSVHDQKDDDDEEGDNEEVAESIGTDPETSIRTKPTQLLATDNTRPPDGVLFGVPGKEHDQKVETTRGLDHLVGDKKPHEVPRVEEHSTRSVPSRTDSTVGSDTVVVDDTKDNDGMGGMYDSGVMAEHDDWTGLGFTQRDFFYPCLDTDCNDSPSIFDPFCFSYGEQTP